jgi:hypothetical protein
MTRWAREPDSIVSHRCDEGVKATEQTRDGEISLIPYGISVTNADLIMADGKSLENAGVVPDYVVLPTAADLAAGRDPALAQAVALVGGVLDPLDAGKLFPIEWKKK